MKRVMRLLLVVSLLGLVSFFVFYIGTHNMGVFNPKGVIALEEMNLIVKTTLLMLIVVIPVFIMLGAFSWKYRVSNKNAKYTPDWHGNVLLEGIWWTIPIIIIAIIGRLTWVSSHELDPYKKLVTSIPPITIEVVALDWKWLFIYPEQNIATVNFVQFPKGVPINFKITADAPMNSFWIPQLAGQIYAMAGMDTRLHIMANEYGEYQGLSANYSGAGFSGMKFIAKAVTREEFDKWVLDTKQASSTLSISEYKRLAEKSRNNQVSHYSSVEKGLYDKIIMKFTKPGGMIEATSTMMHMQEI